MADNGPMYAPDLMHTEDGYEVVAVPPDLWLNLTAFVRAWDAYQTFLDMPMPSRVGDGREQARVDWTAKDFELEGAVEKARQRIGRV